MLSMSNLVGGKPRLEITNTAVKDGRWVVTGKMIVEFVGGPLPGALTIVLPDLGEGETTMTPSGRGLRIEVPFFEASDEEDAIRKGCQRLEKAGNDILTVALAFQGKAPQRQ